MAHDFVFEGIAHAGPADVFGHFLKVREVQ